MPKRVLTITSTTNAHALAAYAGITALGVLHSVIGPGAALSDLLTQSIASMLMGVLALGGITCFSASIMGARERDPTMALTVEIGTLTILSVTLLLFFISLVSYYGTDAPTTITMIAMFLVGSIGRLMQAGHERALLYIAKEQVRSAAESSATTQQE